MSMKLQAGGQYYTSTLKEDLWAVSLADYSY